jgi:hypothetical protein
MNWFIPYNQLDNEQLNFLQNVNSNQTSNYWLKGYAGSGKSMLLIHCLLEAKAKNPDTRVIIVLYTHALIDMFKAGIPAQYSNTRVVTYYQFYRMNGIWDLILVDEVQDLPEYIVRDIQSKGNRVIVAGDINQSIYDDVCESRKIDDILNGNSFSLGNIHKISRRIRKIAQFFCPDRNGFNAASSDRLAESLPRLVKAANYDEECEWLVLTAKEYAQNNYAPGILIPKHIDVFNFFQSLLKIEQKPLLPNSSEGGSKENYEADNDDSAGLIPKYRSIFNFFQSLLRIKQKPLLPDSSGGGSKERYEAINAHLKDNGLKFQYLGNGVGSFDKNSSDRLVTVMTYHSAKGLEFGAVFVPFLNDHLEIWKDTDRAKTLFFVAITRSREQLFLSYSGNKHYFLDLIPENDFHNLNAIDEINRMNNSFSQEEAPEFIF